MSTVKVKVEEQNVFNFLEKRFEDKVLNFNFINGGELSQAFSFSVKKKDLVIRLGKDTSGYEKDKYAFENFSSNNIPIPKIIEIGSFNEKYSYSISEKTSGKTLVNLNDREYEKIFPKLFSVLNEIHHINISQAVGFGRWRANGTTEKDSWREYVLSIKEHVVLVDNKASLFETSFLEKNVWDSVYGKIVFLLKFCPEDKFLVHGDYGSDNVTTENGSITGILDWEESKYGDFLYDVAWLNFWYPNRNTMEFFEHYYTEVKPTKNFKERVLCYQLRIGLSSLSFYAFSSQKEKYDSTKKSLISILEKH